MAIIRLQNINGNLYPTDSKSKEILESEFHLGRIPCIDFDIHAPWIVKRGHKMAITGY